MMGFALGGGYRLFRGRNRVWAGCAIAVLLAAAAGAQDMASFEKRTTVKVLPNGLTLIVCERP